MNCSRCRSGKVNNYKYLDSECYRCLDCGYDSCSELDNAPEERGSQKAKGKHSVYKAGGAKRATKFK